MQIKRFEAKSMTAALRLIKEELGPEAVILSARSIKKGSRVFGPAQTLGVEVTAATDADSADEARKIAAFGQSRIDSLQAAASMQAPSIKKKPAARESGIISRLGKKPAMRRPDSDSEAKQGLQELYQQLVSQGVDRDIALDFAETGKTFPRASRHFSDVELQPLLISLMQKMNISCDPINLDGRRPKVVALVGTTGVGKTTTIAKLAAHYAVDQDKQVALITLDDFRIAAVQQLEVYAKILGLPLKIATSAAEIKKYLKAFKAFDLILIDTPGVSHKNSAQIEEIRKCLEPFNTIETHLLLSSGAKSEDLTDIVKRFQKVGIGRLIFTKLDESKSYGNLVNVLIRTGIPFSHLTAGQNVPDDIEDGSIERLVEVFLTERNAAGSSGYPPSKPKEKNQKKKSYDADFNIYFIANKNSDVYHMPGCKWTAKIKPKHIIEFESSMAAEQRSYQPCRDCNPRRADQLNTSTFERDKIKISTYR